MDALRVKWQPLMALFALTQLDCAANQSASTKQLLESGVWAGESSGGIHVTMTVTNRDASLEFDCAVGGFELPESVDDPNNIEVQGRYVGPNGGVPQASGPMERTVTYRVTWRDSSRSSVDLMILEPNESGSPDSVIGTFSLTFGARPVHVSCP